MLHKMAAGSGENARESDERGGLEVDQESCCEVQNVKHNASNDAREEGEAKEHHLRCSGIGNQEIQQVAKQDVDCPRSHYNDAK